MVQVNIFLCFLPVPPHMFGGVADKLMCEVKENSVVGAGDKMAVGVLSQKSC